MPGTWYRVTPLALVLTLACLSCDAPVPEGNPTGQCSTEDLYKGEPEYFDDVMVPQLFATYCELCHWSDKVTPEDRRGAPPGLNYDDYESAIRWNSTAEDWGTWHRVRTRNMPPMGRTPSTEELQMLLEWIDCALAVQGQGDDDDSSSDDDDSAGDDDDSAGNR